MKYFLKAKDYPRAVSIIERLGMESLQAGRTSDLSQWISNLPSEIIHENPWLLLYQTMAQPYSVGTETVQSLEKAYKLFKQRGETRGILFSLARLIPVSIRAGFQPIPIVQLIEEAKASLHLAELVNNPRETAMLLHALGTGYILVEGEIRKGVRFCQNASLLFRQIKETDLEIDTKALSALGLIQIGEFSLAEDILKSMERTVEKHAHPEFKIPPFMADCLLAIYQGQFKKAKDLCEKLQTEIDNHGFVWMVPWTLDISGYLEFCQRKFAEAEEIGNRYLSLAQSIKNPVYKGLALRLLGLISLHRQDFEKAKERIHQVTEIFSKEAPSRHELTRAKMMMGLIDYHLKEYESAEEALKESLDYFNEISGYQSLTEAHLIMAFHKFAKGQRDEAVFHLETGFQIARERKYEYFYILSDEYLKKACLLALELEVDQAVDYAAHLLATRLSHTPDKEFEPLSHHPNLKIRNRTREIRRTIHRSRAPHLSIETLGGFRVIRGDALMREDEWDRSQPKQLLKAIVSYGTKEIPKETLIDQLWPEERPKSAENDFKTALQRLRKSLEPEMNKEFGSSYIHLQDNIVSLDADLCQVDANDILPSVNKGQEKKKKKNPREALSTYNEAIEMYKGDFLPDETYLPWAEKRREELKGKYVDALGKAANLYDKQGAVRKAIDCHKKMIQVDPLLEESYQKLMSLCYSKGMYNEALRAYESCQKVLKKELHSKPDPLTTALYKMILEKIQST